MSKQILKTNDKKKPEIKAIQFYVTLNQKLFFFFTF